MALVRHLAHADPPSGDDDLQRLGRITQLVDEGVNLAGVARILDLETRNSELESDNARLEAKLGSKRGR